MSPSTAWAIISSSSDSIIATSLDGIVTSWNAAAVRLYGYGASEVIGRSVRTIVPPDLWEDERALMRQVARGEVVVEYEVERVRADGTRLCVASTMSLVTDSTGAAVGLSTIARDVTVRQRTQDERRALEDQLHQSQRLESLGQLAGGVAHDFNNLLAVILNYANFVSEKVSDNPAALADVEEIIAAAERAALLTQQLLVFARRETIQPQILDLNAVVADIQTLLSRTIGEHVELVVDAPPTLPTVRADLGQMEQVLMNLAVNARDAMLGGGTLTIETRSVELDDDPGRRDPDLPAGRYVQVSVSDTGAGMKQEVIDRAFEPFYTTKPKGEGSGLGLATVFGIVTETGGAVTLHSKEDLGTTIRVYLPAADELAPASSKGRDRSLLAGAGETILLVEDEGAMRTVTSRILRRNGYVVVEAAGGSEALDMLAGHDFQLLLTDVVMPLMLGRELADRIHERRPDLPVLFMSGYSQGVLSHQRALDEGVALIQKPFNERALLEKVLSVMTTAAAKTPASEEAAT